MLIPRSVHAHLVERFIFNFRMRPEVLKSHLPVCSLQPQVIQGWSVVSFCLLKLDHVMLSPLPAWPGLKTISCAYRCGVIDTSGAAPEPAVYILERYTDCMLISHLGPWIFLDSMPQVRSTLKLEGAARTMHVYHRDLGPVFAASVEPVMDDQKLDSQVFDSLASFTHFMQQGIASYTPAISENRLSRVDLQKKDTHYEVLNTTVLHNSLDTCWSSAGLIFDSAIRATGGVYKWTYRGLVERDYSHVCSGEK